jgi:CHRD domain
MRTKTLPTRAMLYLAIAALPLSLGARLPADTFTATLSGSSEVPPMQSSATGTATVTLDGNKLTYKIEVKNLDNPTMAHIHKGAPGTDGAPIVPLWKGAKSIGFTGVLAEGTVTVTSDVAAAIRSGDTYVNVHTKQHPAGELRGQLAPAM